MTHSENGTRNGSEIRGHHPRRRRVLVGVKRAGSIIHAEGARVGVPSSAPMARVAALPFAGDPFELAAYVLKILRADAHAEHFLNHWEEIRQRTNRA